jgi:cobalt-zinc-cadmium efflux system membrane fusion protein
VRIVVTTHLSKFRSALTASIVVVSAIILTVAAWNRDRWLPVAQQFLQRDVAQEQKPADHDSGDSHNHAHPADGHDRSAHDETLSIELSPQARKNLNLKTDQVQLQSFTRRVSFPALVTTRPGRSQVQVTAPLGGRVTRIYPIAGETVQTGQTLFDLRMTHEDLVRLQSEFLQAVAERDVVLREIQRLQSVSVSGAIPGKRLLERKYEQQKIDAMVDAKRQSLLLHGLSQSQIDHIVGQRTLLQNFMVHAPDQPRNGDSPDHRSSHENGTEGAFEVQRLDVKPGQYVNAGDPLCMLTDFRRLYIQGRAFEQDATELVQAAREGLLVAATPEGYAEQTDRIDGLKIAYVDNEVELDSRSLRFYVDLTNQVVLESESTDGHRFTTWKYRPGQRMQLHVPVEQWQDRIVLPVDAVAKEGLEYFVFQQNGDHFDRVSVHVEYQDQHSVVIANDGAIFPGDTIAMTDAHQLQIALKNKSGGGVDPHAGHQH